MKMTKNPINESWSHLLCHPIAAPSSSAKPRIDNTTAYTNAIYVSFHPPPDHTLNGELDGYVVMAKKEGANEDFRTVLYEPGATVSQ